MGAEGRMIVKTGGPPGPRKPLSAWGALESDNAPAVQGSLDRAQSHERQTMDCGAQSCPCCVSLGSSLSVTSIQGGVAVMGFEY